MTQSAPQGAAKTRFIMNLLAKHGKRLVVILFCILMGDALPAIIQNALEPDKVFYTIVRITLPYTGALVLILLFWAKFETMVAWLDFLGEFFGGDFLLPPTSAKDEAQMRSLQGCLRSCLARFLLIFFLSVPIILLFIGAALGVQFHWWGFEKVDLNQIPLHPGGTSCNSDCPASGIPGGTLGMVLAFLLVVIAFVLFYLQLYGSATLIAATLASFVITINILQWMKERRITLGPPAAVTPSLPLLIVRSVRSILMACIGAALTIILLDFGINVFLTAVVAQGHTAPDFLNPIVIAVCAVIAGFTLFKYILDMISGKINPYTGQYGTNRTVSGLPKKIGMGFFNVCLSVAATIALLDFLVNVIRALIMSQVIHSLPDFSPDYSNPMVFTVCTIIAALMGLKYIVDMISGKIDPITGQRL
jgi:hypothetical protein